MDNAESEARRALARLRRAAEKVERELGAVAGALRHAEAEDFPSDRYDEIAAAVRLVLDFTEEEGDRLREKILHAGGLSAGRAPPRRATRSGGGIVCAPSVPVLPR